MRVEYWALIVLALALASASKSKAKRQRQKLGGTIGLVGDSYAMGLSTPLAKLLPDDGFLVGQSEVGAHTPAILRWVPDAIAKGATRVLISAGTNDYAAGSDQFARARVEAMKLEEAVRGGPVELIWLESPTGTTVAPVGARTIAAPKMKLADRLHPSGTGYAEWAKKIAREL